MSRAPFFKLFFSDLVGDTLALSDAEMGSYMLLLGAMWNGGGALPNDPGRLARIARCSPKAWGRRWQTLAPYFDADAATISNKRLLSERQKVEAIRADRSAAGKRGAEAKSLKNHDAASANASANDQANDKQPDTRKNLAPSGASETPDAMAWKEGVSLLMANGRMTEKAARSMFGKLLRDHRLAAHQLRPSILTAQQGGTPDPQGYLTAAARGIASRLGNRQAPPVQDVATWEPDVWRIAVANYRSEGAWDRGAMGPSPGEPGCLAPAAVLAEAA